MYCIRCGHPLKPGGKFCAVCGQAVSVAPAPSAGSQAPPPPAAARPASPPPPAARQATPPPPVPRPAPAAVQALPGRTRHSSGLAVAAAVLVPGAGQSYNGQFGLGLLVLLGSALVLPYFLGIWGAARTARRIVAAGGREGRGGFAWILIQAMLGANLLLFTLILLSMTGVLS